MKGAHQVLTVLFFLALAFGLFVMVRSLGRYPEGTVGFGVVLGSLVAASIIPGIIWIIRYFVGKEMKK